MVASPIQDEEASLRRLCEINRARFSERVFYTRKGGGYASAKTLYPIFL